MMIASTFFLAITNALVLKEVDFEFKLKAVTFIISRFAKISNRSDQRHFIMIWIEENQEALHA